MNATECLAAVRGAVSKLPSVTVEDVPGGVACRVGGTGNPPTYPAVHNENLDFPAGDTDFRGAVLLADEEGGPSLFWVTGNGRMLGIPCQYAWDATVPRYVTDALEGFGGIDAA